MRDLRRLRLARRRLSDVIQVGSRNLQYAILHEVMVYLDEEIHAASQQSERRVPRLDAASEVAFRKSVEDV